MFIPFPGIRQDATGGGDVRRDTTNMLHKSILQPLDRRDDAIYFEWDPNAGLLRGNDADRLHEMINNAIASGSVLGHPMPTSYDIQDPLHRVSEMAVLLGQRWQLPEDLAGAYPVPEDEPFAVYLIEEDGTETLLPYEPLY